MVAESARSVLVLPSMNVMGSIRGFLDLVACEGEGGGRREEGGGRKEEREEKSEQEEVEQGGEKEE